MRKFKKSLMACLIAVFAFAMGLGLGFMPKANTAKAAVATEHTVVETPMMGGIRDINTAGGNVQLHVTIPALDNGETTGDDIAFDGVELATVFDSFGFFDNVMISGKTLRELGCTTFWDNALGYNVAQPKPSVYLHLHFDPEKLAAAIADGTVNLAHLEMSTVTFKEGTVIPGYRYLAGLDNAVLFKAGCDYEMSVATLAYERVAVGKTEVNSLKYVQDNHDGTGYFGVSLVGDDFAGVGNTEDCVGNNLAAGVTGWYHQNTILLNGETGKVGYYSLVNLGSKGKGHFSFNAKVSEAELTSVTIPAGTKFPMYFYTGTKNCLTFGNDGKLVCYYEVQTTKTFVKDENGNWYCPEDVEEIETEVVMANPAGGEADYFVLFELSVNDYADLNTYPGNVISARDYFATSNIKSHVLINGEAFPNVLGETFLNVWGTPNTFATRTLVAGAGIAGASHINSITILAGCRFPSYELLETGATKYYVTTEDVTFVRNGDVWEKETPFNLDAYKAEKIAEIEAYKAGIVLDESERLMWVEEAIIMIEDSADKAEVDEFFAEYKGYIDELPIKEESFDLDAYKAEKIAEIEAYKAGMFFEEQEEERLTWVEEAIIMIEDSADKAEVDEFVAEYKGYIDELPTMDDLFDIDAYKAEKTAYIEGYKAGMFFEEEEALRLDSVNIFKDLIGEQATKEAVDGLVDYIIETIDDLPTKSDILEAELRPIKDAAKAELDAYLASGEYNAAQKIVAERAIDDLKALIEEAGDADAVQQALVDAKADLDAIVASLTIVDTAMMVRITDIYAQGGNMNMFVIIPELDLPESNGDGYSFGTKEELEALFDQLGLFDMIYLKDKSLRDWGFAGFWNAELGFNVDGVRPQIYLHMHTNNPAYAEAVASGEIAFTDYKGTGALVVKQSAVTVKQGLMIPGYSFLNGDENAIVYRAVADFVTAGETRPYDLEANAYVNVESVAYVQEGVKESGEVDGYFGFSLEGDDYPAFDGDFIVVDEKIRNYVNYNQILINGNPGYVGTYSLYNLGENGKGRIAISVSISEADMHSVTIPAGTIFPAYAANAIIGKNGENRVFFYYRTASEITFVKADDGSWVKLDDYKANALATLDNAKAGMLEENYFADEYAVLVAAYEEGKATIEGASTIEAIDSALEAALASMQAISEKTGVIAEAKEEISNYKAGMFREAEEAIRLSYVEAALEALDTVGTKDEIADVISIISGEIDKLKTAAQYADEELAEVKASAREEISNYLDLSNYYADEQAEIALAIEAGHQGVANATNEAEIAQAIVDAKAVLDAILVKEEVVAAVKAELAAYKSEEGYFRAEEKAQRDTIVANALAELEGLTDKTEIDAIVAEAKEAVDALTTADEHLEAELADAKATARAEIESYLADGEYLDSQVADRTAVVEAALASLVNAKSVEEIAQVVEEAKAEIDTIVARVTIVDVAMMVRITEIYTQGGNLNMFIVIPGLDLPESTGDGKQYAGYSKEALEALFEDFGLYDMVYIEGRSLRDWGFTGFWNDSVGFNVDGINPHIYLHMHTDSPAFAEAVANGEITFTKYESGALSIKQSEITVEKGLIIPGNAFLSGDENAFVYRAVADFVTAGEHRPYDLEANAYVNVDSVAYVAEGKKETGEVDGYFGISLEGDDYPAFEGDHIIVDEQIRNYVNYDGILINGEPGHVDRYAVYNLGEKGKGRISISVSISEADMYSVTIPEGTMFPAYASNVLPAHNGGNGIFFFYRTVDEITFIKTADGSWLTFADYVQSAKDELDALKAEKEALDCFEADITLIADTVANAKAALDNATLAAEIEEIFASAKAVISAVEAKDAIISSAKAEIEGYKTGLFRDAEESTRLATVASAKEAIDGATSGEEVATIVANAKVAIDALKTADEYAREEIATNVADAKSELDAYKAEASLYRDEEKAARLAIIEEAKLALDAALTVAEVESIVAAAKADIDALKTDAEYDNEELLATKRAEAIAQINTKKASIDLSLYTDDSILTISTLYNDAKQAVELATSEDAIAQIVDKFSADIDAVPQKGQGATSTPVAPAPVKKGCLGSIGGISSVFALLTVMAAAVVLKKRK